MIGKKPSENFRPHRCEVHDSPKEFFCVAKECMRDLCRLCLRFHNDMHQEQETDAMIESLPTVIDISHEKLNRMSWGYKGELKKLERAKLSRESHWEEVISEIRLKIEHSKKVVIEEVLDPYFSAIENKLMQEYIYPAKKHGMESLDTLMQDLQFKINKCDSALKGLTKEKKEKEMIKYIFYKDESFILERVALIVENAISKDNKLTPNANKVEIVYEHENLDKVFCALQDFISYSVNLKDLITDYSVVHLTNIGDQTNDFQLDNSIINGRNQFIRENNNQDSLNGSFSNKNEPRIPPMPYQDTKNMHRINSSPMTVHKDSKQTEKSNGDNNGLATIFGPDKFSSTFTKKSGSNNFNDEPQPEKGRPLASFQSFEKKTPSLTPQQSRQESNETAFTRSLKSNSWAKEIPIEGPNFFQEDVAVKMLHFFEPRTKNFYYTDLDSLAEKVDKNLPLFEKHELNINFTIPRHHRSIITSTGDMIMIGGLCEEQGALDNPPKITFLNKCYILDFEHMTLVEIQKLAVARAATSVLLTSFGIVVAGGITHNCEVTSSCEMYMFEKNTWVQLADMNQATMHSTLCYVKDRFVVKIGGKVDEVTMINDIEVLDLENNSWHFLELPMGLPKIPVSAAALEISEDSLLIFGGNYENNSDKSDEIFLVKISQEGIIENFSKVAFSLPQPDSFFNQQGIIYGDRIFALQNMSNPENKESVFQNSKRIVVIERDAAYSLQEPPNRVYNL